MKTIENTMSGESVHTVASSIAETLASIPEARQEELRFLAHYCKVERQIMDYIAFRMHEQNSTWEVERECKRRDLVVKRAGCRAVIVEAKQQITTDLAKVYNDALGERYPEYRLKLLDDALKIDSFRNTEGFADAVGILILFNIHWNSIAVRSSRGGVQKYGDLGDLVEFRYRTENWFKIKPQYIQVCKPAGDLETTIDAAVWGPFGSLAQLN